MIDLGSHVATPRTSSAEKKISQTDFDPENVDNLERWIDEFDQELPPLTNFILPSGGLAASQTHIARTVCRRAERDMVKLLQEETIDEHAYKYINRLSDYLFMLARYCAMKDGKVEVVYQKSRKAMEQDEKI